MCNTREHSYFVEVVCESVFLSRACCFLPKSCWYSMAAVRWCDEFKECDNILCVEPPREDVDIKDVNRLYY